MSKVKLSWDDFYNLVKAYYNYHRNLDIPSKFKTINGYEEDDKGIDIGTWIQRQRIANDPSYPFLSEEKIEKLNNIEMIWDIKKYRWDQRYSLAKAYYDHHGNLDTPKCFKTKNGYEKDQKGFDIGKWIMRQKRANNPSFPILSKEQIEKLNDIGIVWNFYEDDWEQMYPLAKAYYDHHGNLDVRSGFKTKNGHEEDEEGLNLGSWIDRQRPSEDNTLPSLNKERIEKLNNIGMIWDIKEYRWNGWYNLAKAYHDYHGNLDVPSEYITINGYEEAIDGFNLGGWIMRQRLANNPIFPTLSKKQIEKLDNIEMIWNIKEYRQKQRNNPIDYSDYHIKIENDLESQSSYNNNTSSTRKINQGYTNQLGENIDVQIQENNKKQVNSLEEAMDETIKDYGYDKLTDRVKQLVYCIILHIDSMNQDEYAYKVFTEKNGAREYIKSKGKNALIEEIEQSLNIDNESIDNIYQEYANNYYAKKCNKEKVNSLEGAIDETVKDYEYEKNSDRMEMLIYCLISHIDRIDQYEDADLAFTEKNGAREYIKSRGKNALIEEMYYSLALNENVDSISDIYQEYANNYYNKKYNKELPNKKKF